MQITNRTGSLQKAITMAMVSTGILIANGVFSPVMAVTITVDANARYQQWTGFGGRPQNAADGDFDWQMQTFVNELGLTMARGGTDDGRESLDQWRRVVAAGFTKCVPAVWQPPSGFKDGDCKISYDRYNDYADYIVSYCRQFKERTGIYPYAISIQNEPRFCSWFGGVVYTGKEYANMLGTVGKKMEAEGLWPLIKFYGPEDMIETGPGWLKDINEHPDARKYLDVIAAHGYLEGGVTPSSGANFLRGWGGISTNLKKEFWMSETSGYSGWAGSDRSAVNAVATFIASTMLYANSSAFLIYGLNGSSAYFDASQNVNDEYALIRREKMPVYYAFKHFSKFVHEGATRVAIASTDESVIEPVAWHNENAKTLTIVIINTTTSPQTVSVAGDVPQSFSVYTSTNSAKWQNASGNSGTAVTVPAQSLVTIHGENYAPDINVSVAPSFRGHSQAIPKSRLSSSGVQYSIDGRVMGGEHRYISRGVYLLKQDATVSRRIYK